MSSESSPEDARHSYKKKRRHRSSSNSPPRRERRLPDGEGQSQRHRHHKHGHRDRHERDRPKIKIEQRESPEGSYHRSRSPVDHRHQRHDRDRKPVIKRERIDRDERGSRDQADRRHHDRRREEHRRNRGDDEWGQLTGESVEEEKPKDKPDFGLSGKLTEETNTYKGVVIKYNEPPEARKPRKRWRLYPFKGDQALPVMHIHRQSAFLFGRDRRIADLPVDHPSCSKQHAVLQYRLVDNKRDNGKMGRKIKPYVIDLGSANGTYVNNQRIDDQRYVELLEKDVIKFGFSSREYVILHDNVKVEDEEQEEHEDDTS